MTTKVSFRLLTAFIAMMLLVVACGGGASLKDQIIGTWEAEKDGIKMSFEFDKEGNVTIGAEGITFDATYTWTDDDSIEIVMDLMGTTDTLAGDVEISGNTMKLTAEGETVEFTKAK